MTTNAEFFSSFHWQQDLLSSMEVGIVVLDKAHNVVVWNRFMENHSAKLPSEVQGKPLFDSFPEIEKDWFRIKAETVYNLGSPAFIIWEQRPYLFRFSSNRPVTSPSPFMYQNTTMFPLNSSSGEIDHICMVIYDVTDEAISKQNIQALNSKLQQTSRIDGLTGIYNRRYFDERFNQEFMRMQRSQVKSCCIMLDIDHFKKVNDTYGHAAGDQVIKALASLVKKSIRETDICGRYGGEEFAIFLLETERAGGNLVAERIRKVSESLVTIHDGIEIKFTVSVGLCEYNESYSSAGQWLEKADQRLYKAKESGRNRVISSD